MHPSLLILSVSVVGWKLGSHKSGAWTNAMSESQWQADWGHADIQSVCSLHGSHTLRLGYRLSSKQNLELGRLMDSIVLSAMGIQRSCIYHVGKQASHSEVMSLRATVFSNKAFLFVDNSPFMV